MSSSNCSVLIHTFSGYRFAWNGCLNGWKHIKCPFPMYFGSDMFSPEDANYDYGQFKLIYSTYGEWSDRLKILLKQVKTKYVLYMQEDHWPTNQIDFEYYLDIMKDKNLLRLQLSPIIQFYSLYGSEPPYYFWEQAKSKYLVSHQPSIWDVDFLMSVLIGNLSPWKHEYEATCDLWARSAEIKGKIAIYPVSWFKHMVSQGKLKATPPE